MRPRQQKVFRQLPPRRASDPRQEATLLWTSVRRRKPGPRIATSVLSGVTKREGRQRLWEDGTLTGAGPRRFRRR